MKTGEAGEEFLYDTLKKIKRVGAGTEKPLAVKPQTTDI